MAGALDALHADVEEFFLASVESGSLLSPFDEARSERASVRNVVVGGSGRGGRLWKARAAFDTMQRSLVASPDFVAGDGGPGEAELVTRLMERLCAFPGFTQDAVSPHDVPSDAAGGVPIEGLAIDPTVLETASQLALRVFPAGSRVEWYDDVDENDVPLELMTVSSPASATATHEAYVAFIRAWVRAEPPQRRRRIRVSCRAGILG
jgi:hypothetical protein